MTNADKIRSMNDEELAEFFDRILNEDNPDWDPLGCFKCIDYGTHHYPKDCGGCKWLGGISGWLKQEAE